MTMTLAVPDQHVGLSVLVEQVDAGTLRISNASTSAVS